MAGGKIQKPNDGQNRVVITHVTPEIDAGRFAAKRVEGDTVVVEADIFGDGHDHVEARLLWRRAGEKGWVSTPLRTIGNDRWQGSFPVAVPGNYEYTIVASIDHFDTWQDGLRKKLAAGQDVALELQTGSLLVEAAAARAKGKDQKQLQAAAKLLRTNGDRLGLLEQGTGSGIVSGATAKPAKKIKSSTPDASAGSTLVAAPNDAPAEAVDSAGTQRATLAAPGLASDLLALVTRYPNTALETRHARTLLVEVDRERARYSTWYELFPRSAGPDAQTHGTLADVEGKLPYLKKLGFDVLYLPPIHPVGRSFRKGKNNAVTAQPGDIGSPWAIGAAEGGHTDLLPELGTMADFDRLLQSAAAHGLELALDIAFQCAPDHPWVAKHPDWFKHRADGSIQYAENPPKKYQDIYPIDFESTDWKALWDALADVFLFWAERGVRIFRVDNPHTKAFPFWEWCIAEVKRQYPDALFLAEAFTRPRVMEQLAKVGFSQSYTYFCWRTTAAELTEYLTELTQTEQWQYFRPNFWPNTPDINPLNLQHTGAAAQPAHALRFVLAATLNPSYGIYGGTFENLVNAPFRAGGEEYLDSEKYELKHWPLALDNPTAQLIATVNRARREHPALRTFDQSLRFHHSENPQLLAYSKRSADGASVVLTVVNLDPSNRQSGWLYLDTAQLALTDQSTYTCEDLLSGASYTWTGPSNFVALDPVVQPAHLFVVRA
ncbi:alpha-1,4-glucan--maltose-1-phosphate maltosyltransferase [Acidipila sp. EB88]|uniref:alpha-1,4-glucan--maltose-1-phosphate maltosyltransferase n=1 Tax=Acidipila sp. EB88 TaxID=2305226 RepID=UPI000F5F66AA|nr:alpha-1,4-glucan--maltose-1-phosphate maltosyltransferase [Acidipila sp. EB88]RRA47334.1 alpha-1,4-glucan--maltose-1-phosphate maltosyltransferase [Acidipila sp. EB88]